MISDFFEENKRLLGTPVKKRKLSKPLQEQQSVDLDLQFNRKKSLVDAFHFIMPLNKKDSCFQPSKSKHVMEEQFQSFNSFWNESEDFGPANYKDRTRNDKVGQKVWTDQEFNFPVSQFSRFQIENENERVQNQSSSQQQVPKELKLMKRATMINYIYHNQKIPNLFRCNSGIDIDQQINEADERKYGDNVYMQEINKLKRKMTNGKQNNSRISNGNDPYLKGKQRKGDKKVYRGSDDQELENNDERLLRDYKISSNIHAYVRHHQNFLCLNKLERVFYYIKKINFSDQFPQQEIFSLCQSQIKIYNRDDEGRMLRFYQSWQQEDCMYLVFETASTSLEEKLDSAIKLRQNQIWSLLIDVCKTLGWMKNNDEYHFNIKPGNILKCRERYKLSDPFISVQIVKKAFSAFKGQSNEEEKLKAAFKYAAPELLQFHQFSQGLSFQKCDIFSLGLCILENISGISVNLLKRNLNQFRNNAQKHLKGYSRALRNLLIRMISSNPNKRPSCEQIGGSMENQFWESKQYKAGSSETSRRRKMSI